MAGYDLKEGHYEIRNISDDELWAAFSYVFSSKSRNTTSYKYGFLKAIIDNLYNVDENLKLTFDQLFSKFGEIYWNLILKHGLRQNISTVNNGETYLEQILHSAAAKYCITEPIPYESLTTEMMLDISHQVKNKCKKYVVGALFEDTNHLFYSFSKKDEWLQINPIIYEFICKHKLIIEKLNYSRWAQFLEKINPETRTTKLINKIDESAKRNNLYKYRQILYEEFESNTCFYCGCPLHPNKIDVDHFIPWSFIKNDNLWNLVLACPTCNRKKSDKLPDERYLPKIYNRNQLICTGHVLKEMEYYRPQIIKHVYDWAKINGYDRTWKPANSKIL